MKKTFSQLNEIISSLQSKPEVTYRIFIYKIEDTWLLYAGFFDVCDKPTASKTFFYNYGEVAFLAGISSGAEIGKWLSKGHGQSGEVRFKIPRLQEDIYSRVSKSGNLSSFLGVEEPHSIYEISISDKIQIDKNKALIASGCPSFLSLHEAIYWFLYDKEIRNSSYVFPDKIDIRWIYDDIWIKKIELKPGKINISIEGKNVRGVRLEIRSGTVLSIDKKLKTGGMKTFTIPLEISQDIFVILSRDRDYLDYEYIDPLYQKNIKAKDFPTEISEIVLQGESETLEFKEQVPKDSEKYLKTVVAFANGNGGMILFGVDDETFIKGILNKLDSVRNQITDAICNRIEPRPKFHFQDCLIKNKSVIALTVEAGDLHPYGIINNKTIDIYIRTNSSTRLASQREIRELSRKGLEPVPSNRFLPL